MADINLLPEEFRSQEQKERDKAKKQAKEIAVPLTNPERNRQNNQSGWHKIFGGLKNSAFKSLGKSNEKIEPAMAKNGNLNIVKTDISGLFRKIDRSESVTAPAKNLSSQNDRGPRQNLPVEQANISGEGNISVPKPTPPATPLANLSASLSHSASLKNIKSAVNDKTNKPSGSVDNIQILHSSTGGLLAKLLATVQRIFNRPHNKGTAIAVDLMPERLLTLKEINWSRVSRTLLVSIGLGVTSIFIGYLILFNKNQQQESDFRDLEQQLADSNVKIISLLDEQQAALLLQKKLQLADSLISDHIYWSKFLDFLELNTLAGVYFEGLSLSLEATEVSLQGRAENLATIFWQRDKLASGNDLVTSVSLVSFNVDPTTAVVSFELQLQINQQALKK